MEILQRSIHSLDVYMDTMYGPIWDGPDIHLTKGFYFKMTRELIAFSQYMSTYFPKKKIFVFNMVKLHYLLNFKYHKMQLSVVLPSKIYIQCSVEYRA